MGKISLGVIGKGGAIQHLLETLTTPFAVTEHHRSEEIYLRPLELVNSFYDLIDEIVFFNYGYETNEFFERSLLSENESYFQELCNKLEVKVEDNFNLFFHDNDIILDASGAYRPISLLNYAKALDQGKNLDETGPPKLDLEEDLKIARREFLGCHKSFDDQSFRDDWKLSLKVLEAISGVHDEFPLGGRSLWRTPFSIPTLIRRSQQIRRLNEKLRINPTYINIVNEPCTTSDIMSGICPDIIPYLVALTGVDMKRLELSINEDEHVLNIKRKNGFSDNWIHLRNILGRHDDYLMVPVIEPRSSEDSLILEAVSNEINYDAFFREMQQAIGSFWGKNQGGERVNVREDVTRNILETIISAALSRVDPLSVYPSLEALPLNNGFFTRVFEKDDQGIFLTGNHRFLNGMVYPYSERNEYLEVDKLPEVVSTQVVRLMNKILELGKELIVSERSPLRETSLLVENIDPEPRIHESNQSGIIYPPEIRPPIEKGVSFATECYVVMKKGLSKITYPNIGDFKVEELLTPSCKGSQVKLLSGFCIGDMFNLIVGKRYSLELFNTLNLQRSKNINLDSSFVKAKKPYFNSFGVLSHGKREHEKTLVTTYGDAGIISVPFEEILNKEEININSKGQFIPLDNIPSFHAHLMLAASGSSCYLAAGRNLYFYESTDKEPKVCFETENLPISALDLSQDGAVYFGTIDGKIYRGTIDKGFRKIYENPSRLRIHQVKASNDKSSLGVYFTVLVGGNSIKSIRYTDDSEDSVEDTLFNYRMKRIMDFYVMGGTHFALDVGQEKVVIKGENESYQEVNLKGQRPKFIYTGGQ